jgi:hypothetical protein
MVALARCYDVKSYHYEKAKEQARLDQMFASLVKREITDEDSNRAVFVRCRVIRPVGEGR